MIKKQAENKTKLAKRLGISRSSLYYKHKRPAIDIEIKDQIESVMVDHPDYGHKRVAFELKLNHKRILRVMNKFGIKPYKKKARKPSKKDDLNKPPSQYPNLIKDMVINKPDLVWITDFTYIRYQTKFIYLATIIDLFTRQVVGVNISRFHNKYLVIGALLNALDNYPKPVVVHSDQGSEYNSRDFIDLCLSQKITISMSTKGSPWQNGYQESFFGRFKTEFGDFNRFDSLGELIEEIYLKINYYNQDRLHTSLKTTPNQFRINYKLTKGGMHTLL
jgi:transposase InsO family protein